MTITRYDPAIKRDGKFSGMWEMDDGEYVLHADAQAALTAIERAAYERGVRAMADMVIGALAVPQIGTVPEIVRDVQRALLTQEGR